MSKCDCEKNGKLSPAVLQINNHDCPTVFHKVTFPAAMGDDETNPPRNGQYRNVLLVYEANGHAYMFSSDGIPTLISDGGQGVDDYNELTNKPSIEGHELAGDSSLEDIGVTDAIEDALEDYSPTSEFAEVSFTGDYGDLIGAPTIPTKTSDLTNDGADNTSVYVEADELATVATSGSYNDLSNTPVIPSYSDFTGATSSVAGAAGLVPAPAAGDDTKFLSGDGTWKTVSSGSSYTAGNGISIDANNEISIDGTVVAELSDLPTDFTGATASVAGVHGLVPAPAAGDQGKVLKGDGTWGDKSEKFVIMKYGESNAWAKFIAAYNENAIVYCRASSNANPATGSQTRLAFMAYVSSETAPTSVEFQYVRSVSSKTSSQPVDQVFVYKLESTNGGTWTVQTRDMAPKLAAGTNTTVSYSNGTYTVSATDGPTRTVIYNNTSGTNADFITTAAMSGYDAVEITYRDGNQNYETKTVPGSASSFVLDISHPGADSTIYWYVSRFLVSGTSVTVGANNTRKAITASGVTSTLTQDIYVTSVVGINY